MTDAPRHLSGSPSAGRRRRGRKGGRRRRALKAGREVAGAARAGLRGAGRGGNSAEEGARRLWRCVARRRRVLLQVPDLAEQRGQPGVLCPPRHQHLRVGVVEGAQFREAPDEAGEVLGVLRVVDLRVLVEDAQERLLQLLDVPLVPQERAVCGAPGHSAVTGTQRVEAPPRPRARRGGRAAGRGCEGRLSWRPQRLPEKNTVVATSRAYSVSVTFSSPMLL